MHYDVVVIGGGPAGIAATISAARCGASTLLVEKNAYPGGMSTSGLMNVWCGDSGSGIYHQIYDMTTIVKGTRKVYDTEMLKTVYLALLQDCGANMLFHSTFIHANMNGSHIQSIRLLCGSELADISADVYIDATGNGFVAKSAGVDYCKGRESDHLMQPVSLMFSVGGVDDTRAVYPSFGTHPELEQKMQQYINSGLLQEPLGHIILVPGYHKGTANVNMSNLTNIDGTNASQLTNAEIITRNQVPQIVRFLQDCVPGYRNCYIIQTASYVGVRETLHFEGEYKLTENDISDSKTFDDWIATEAQFGFGNHSLTGSGQSQSDIPRTKIYYSIWKYSPKRMRQSIACR